MMVSAGLTAALEGKKLPSTTYRLSTSCALQFVSRADIFGSDPKMSALDTNCKAHEVDNLYVVDGSFFPSSAAVNPALTIMANALRVVDHLIQRLRISTIEKTNVQALDQEIGRAHV